MKGNVKLLTTGDVAGYCGVSRMGVIRWIREGKLQAYTTPGGHYRIRLSDFYDFLKRFDIPVDASLFGAESRRILIMTNDPSALATVVEALTAMGEGYEIDVALDSYSAVAKVADGDPALVVVDSALSGLDGSSLPQQFRAELERRNLPVLILTPPADGHARQEQPASVAASSSSAGPGQYFLYQVPLEVDTLQVTVRRLLGV